MVLIYEKHLPFARVVYTKSFANIREIFVLIRESFAVGFFRENHVVFFALLHEKNIPVIIFHTKMSLMDFRTFLI